jgi:4'-phosphopantetheinyl transferase
LEDRVTDRSVEVWTVRLDPSDHDVAALEKLLEPGEIARANRFVFEHLRRTWITARAALRILLGTYLGVPGESIRLKTEPKGKPALDIRGELLRFNLSHSGEVALFGFTRACEIGVDVEQARPMDDMGSIAERFFHPEEARELLALPVSEREAAFFRCWTRKEAYLKAIGEGFFEPLESFRVSFLPGEPAGILRIRGDANAARAWTVHDVESVPGHAAALVYRDAPRPVRLLPRISPDKLLQLI